MSRDLPPGVGVTDIPGNRPEDVAWEKAHELLDRVATDPEEAILIVKWAPRLEAAADDVQRAFTDDHNQTTLERLTYQGQALRKLNEVLAGLSTDRMRRDEDGKPVPIPPRGWYDHEEFPERTMTCSGCGARIVPPGIDGKCVECAEDRAEEPIPAGPPDVVLFGGRGAGQPCGCGGTLGLTCHEGVASPGVSLDCADCGASYREDGAHWCPACETWPERWEGGTDADPRPVCCNCGADQPGWKPRIGCDECGYPAAAPGRRQEHHGGCPSQGGA